MQVRIERDALGPVGPQAGGVSTAPAARVPGSSHSAEASPLLGAGLALDPARLVRAARAVGLDAVAERLAKCGRGPTVWDGRPGRHAPLVDASGVPIRLAQSCRHRLCPRCGVLRAAHFTEKLGKLIRDRFEGPPIFVTLTRAPVDGMAWGDLATGAVDGFGRLRSYAVWKRRVRGGFFVVHVAGADALNVHIHAVIDAEFISQSELEEGWKRALRKGRRGANGPPVGARIEEIRSLDSVTRYALQAVNPDDLACGALESVVRWIEGRRLVQPFGTLHGVVVREPTATTGRPPKPTRTDSKRVAYNAATGEPVAGSWWRGQASAAAEAEVAAHVEGRKAALRETLPDMAADGVAPASERKYEIRP